MTQSEDIAHRFAYHAPSTPVVAASHGTIRDAHHGLALLVSALVPAGREQSLAITKLEEAMMWANAGIARNQSESNDLAVIWTKMQAQDAPSNG